MALQGCIGAQPNQRTKASIIRYFCFYDGDYDSDALNQAWLMKRDAGCPSCGLVRKIGGGAIGYCARCARIRRIIRDAPNPLRIIPSMIAAEHERTLARLSKAQRQAYLQAKQLRDLALSMNC